MPSVYTIFSVNDRFSFFFFLTPRTGKTIIRKHQRSSHFPFFSALRETREFPCITAEKQTTKFLLLFFCWKFFAWKKKKYKFSPAWCWMLPRILLNESHEDLGSPLTWKRISETRCCVTFTAYRSYCLLKKFSRRVFRNADVSTNLDRRLYASVSRSAEKY